MNTFFYIIIFIIGCLFGSFFTLAVYRLPKKQDIIYTHSYCPNCEHKLGFLELIPIVSYIALRGKCIHCGQKIRIRYLILEALSGLVFVLIALSLKLDLYTLDINKVIYFSFIILYIATLFIIAGIDKEKNVIQKSVLLFSLILGVCFMIYVCISNGHVIYTYIIFLALMVFILILDMFSLKKNLCDNYTISVLLLSLYMILFLGSEIYYYTIALTLFLIGLSKVIDTIKEVKRSKVVVNMEKGNKFIIPIGFYMSISNIFLMIISNFLR